MIACVIAVAVVVVVAIAIIAPTFREGRWFVFLAIRIIIQIISSPTPVFCRGFIAITPVFSKEFILVLIGLGLTTTIVGLTSISVSIFTNGVLVHSCIQLWIRGNGQHPRNGGKCGSSIRIVIIIIGI